ncbi:MAG: hypothetical protein AAGA56_27420, partial [Myxococcota bacterium]
VFRGDPVRTAPLAAGETCAVPCDQVQPGCPGKDCIPALTGAQRNIALTHLLGPCPLVGRVDG